MHKYVWSFMENIISNKEEMKVYRQKLEVEHSPRLFWKFPFGGRDKVHSDKSFHFWVVEFVGAAQDQVYHLRM